MAKTLLYRLFGWGRLPPSVMRLMEQEGIVLCDEGIRGTATYRNFRSPQRYSNWRREWYTAAVALTRLRFTGFARSSPIIDIPLADQRLRALTCSLEGKETLCVCFDAATFHNDWSGTITYRFRTPQAQMFLEHLRDYTLAP